MAIVFRRVQYLVRQESLSAYFWLRLQMLAQATFYRQHYLILPEYDEEKKVPTLISTTDEEGWRFQGHSG
jgi:hypothetical protein